MVVVETLVDVVVVVGGRDSSIFKEVGGLLICSCSSRRLEVEVAIVIFRRSRSSNSDI
jgi:hypothetical protein